MFPQGFTCPVVLWILPLRLRLRLRGSHPLRPAFPGPFRCPPQSLVQSEPQRARALVWALPVPLAATPGITVVFSSSGYLAVSVRRVPSSMPMCSAWGGGVFPRRVSPFRHLRIAGHLLLPAAFRSLSRLSSAPGAKASALCPSSLNRGTPCAVPLSRLAWRYRRVHPRHRCLASLDFRPAHAPACMAAPPPGGLPSGSSFGCIAVPFQALMGIPAHRRFWSHHIYQYSVFKVQSQPGLPSHHKTAHCPLVAGKQHSNSSAIFHQLFCFVPAATCSPTPSPT